MLPCIRSALADQQEMFENTAALCRRTKENRICIGATTLSTNGYTTFGYYWLWQCCCCRYRRHYNINDINQYLASYSLRSKLILRQKAIWFGSLNFSNCETHIDGFFKNIPAIWKCVVHISNVSRFQFETYVVAVQLVFLPLSSRETNYSKWILKSHS